MNLTKENVKKICGIILFTVVVLVIVQNYEKVGNAIGLLWGIIFPFVLGGIIGHCKRRKQMARVNLEIVSEIRQKTPCREGKLLGRGQ